MAPTNFTLYTLRNEDGTVAAGPPPRPLYEREWAVRAGDLLVRQAALPNPKQG